MLNMFLPNENIGSQLEVGMEVDVVGWGQQIATNQFGITTIW